MGCCDGTNSPALASLANLPKEINVWFDHGLGDCVHIIAIFKQYERLGVKIRVHCEENKQEIFDAAGFERCGIEGTEYHRFAYPPDFNHPKAENDRGGSKLWGNIYFQDEAKRIQFWEEMLVHPLDGMLQSIVTPKIQSGVDKLIAHLPEPIVLMHTVGTNWPESKNIPNETTLQAYEQMLDAFSGSIILLDWDLRVPEIKHARMRSLKKCWGHFSIAQTAAMYNRASLLIGIDSGPFHLAAMTDLPAMGVFHHHYPSCVTLPRAKNINLTRNADSYRPCNQSRRERWNIVEYGTTMPIADDFTRNALRMLAGCRYLNNPAKLGNDVMLQQWVRDWMRQKQSLAPRADRDITFDRLLIETTKRFDNPLIVETGCIRSAEDWSAGYSTYLFAAYTQMRGKGNLISVDITAENLATAARLVADWNKLGQCQFVESDSVEYFRANEFDNGIDVLYLDSMDTHIPEASQHCLREFKAAEPHLRDDSLILIDDTAFDQKWIGKGAKAVPYILERGYRLLASGYQCLFSKKA